MCILGDVERELDEKIKRDWKVIYKCRNCGRLFEREAILLKGFSCFNLPTNTVLAPHKCDTGVYGYGDIQASITSRDEDWRDETGSKDYIPQEDD